MTSARTHRRLCTLLVITAAMFLAGCGSSGGQTLPPSTRSTGSTTTNDPTTTVAATTTTTVLSGDAAMIAAQKLESDTFFDVASHVPVNPLDPRISQVAAGKQLGNVRNSLTVLELKRHHDVGTFTLADARVAERNSTGTIVVVLACGTDDIAEVSDTTGQIISPAANTSSLINTQVSFLNGHWIVTDSGVRSPTC
jgi:predicted small lipoprotein YifL